MSEAYLQHVELKTLYESLPEFTPYISTSLLPYMAFTLLLATFVLGFYFSTVPKDTIPVREMSIASAASLLAGFGVVALFCSAGVYV